MQENGRSGIFGEASVRGGVQILYLWLGEDFGKKISGETANQTKFKRGGGVGGVAAIKFGGSGHTTIGGEKNLLLPPLLRRAGEKSEIAGLEILRLKTFGPARYLNKGIGSGNRP